MGRTDAELVDWLSADVRMKPLVGAGLLAVAGLRCSLAGTASAVQWHRRGALGIQGLRLATLWRARRLSGLVQPSLAELQLASKPVPARAPSAPRRLWSRGTL